MISVPQIDWPRLERLATADVAFLELLWKRLSTLRPVPVKDIIASLTEPDFDETVGEFVLFLNRLAGVAQNQSITASNLVSSLGEFISAHAAARSWTPEGWKERSALVVAMISEGSPLFATGRAAGLAADYPNLLMDSHTLSDVRHVFDGDGVTIIAAVITHTLVLDFQDERTEKQTLHMRLDEADIANLIEQLKRTQKKATALRDNLKEIPDLTPVS